LDCNDLLGNLFQNEKNRWMKEEKGEEKKKYMYE